MSQNNTANSKRIAKNTMVLYVRMLFLMLISLYTSRVILEALGVEDFGIYNVVGGFVALFSVVSKSLSGAASRFLNYEMGRGDKKRLNETFSATVTIQLFLAIIILILTETIGLWFLNNKMVIPSERLTAANWCFQLSLVTFCSNLITVPYNAAIIAHERMKAFAYVSIFEGVSKLGISFLIMISPIDRLVFYAILLCLLQFCIRWIYRLYCRKQFEECSFHFVYKKEILKPILGYAGWGIIGSTSGILRTQGINVLINLFFGPTINAARAVANQVLHAVDGFVNNFITAVRPQITQSYAAGNHEYMVNLAMKSAKFSYFLFLLLSMPIIINTDFILSIWLKNAPEHSALFVQLTLVFTLISTLTHPLSIAQAATGKIRDYQLVIGGLQLLNLPISYVCLKMGCIPESVLFVAIAISLIVVFVSMYMLHQLIPFDIVFFIKTVLMKVMTVTILTYFLSVCINHFMPTGILFFIANVVISIIITAIIIATIGCNQKERSVIMCRIEKIKQKFLK